MRESRKLMGPCAGFVLACLVCCAGCNRGERAVYPVSGRVEFSDGENAKFGDIEFRSESEPPYNARGKIARDGTFQLQSKGTRNGTVAGWHQVIIVQTVGNPLYGEIQHDHGRLLDRKYASYQTTDLRVEVTSSGENQLVLTVEEMVE